MIEKLILKPMMIYCEIKNKATPVRNNLSQVNQRHSSTKEIVAKIKLHQILINL